MASVKEAATDFLGNKRIDLITRHDVEEQIETVTSSLLAPVRRVTGYDTIMPLPRLERHYLPTAARIAAAARELMAWR